MLDIHSKLLTIPPEITRECVTVDDLHAPTFPANQLKHKITHLIHILLEPREVKATNTSMCTAPPHHLPPPGARDEPTPMPQSLTSSTCSILVSTACAGVRLHGRARPQRGRFVCRRPALDWVATAAPHRSKHHERARVNSPGALLSRKQVPSADSHTGRGSERAQEAGQRPRVHRWPGTVRRRWPTRVRMD